MANRVMILCMVLSSRGVRFFLEQPAQSCLDELPRFQQMLITVKACCLRNVGVTCAACAACCIMAGVGGLQVHGTRWWMGRYGAKNAKPHKAWSNDPQLLAEIHARAGHITREEMAALKLTQEQAMVKVGMKESGKRTYSGSSTLRESQPLDY